MQLFLTIFLSSLIQAKKKYKNVCDYYLCADSSAVKCRKSKYPRNTGFCASSSSSDSSMCSSRYADRRYRYPEILPIVETRDAVELVQSILASQAFNAKFIITKRENELLLAVDNAFTELANAILVALNASYERLIALVSTIPEESPVEELVIAAINEANDILTASVCNSCIKNSAFANKQVKNLSGKSDKFIIDTVKDTKGSKGLCAYLRCDFDNILDTVSNEFAIIEEKEIVEIKKAFATAGIPLSESSDLILAIRAELLTVTTVIGQLVTLAKNKLGTSIFSIYREIELSLDLLFCQTNHNILDIVKQISNGQRVTVPQNMLCIKEPQPPIAPVAGSVYAPFSATTSGTMISPLSATTSGTMISPCSATTSGSVQSPLTGGICIPVSAMQNNAEYYVRVV